MAVSTTPTDDELLRRMIAGDEDAFVMLYRRRGGGIYRFALQMSASEAIAEDVTQEVFMALMRDSSRFDPSRGTLAAYLYGIARHHVLRLLARDCSYVPIGDAESDAGGGDGAPHDQLIAPQDPLGDLTRREVIEQVRHAITALPPHYREVVVLCELHELSYTEAAAALGCAVGTVRSRLHRARAMLADKLRATEQRPAADSHTLKTSKCFA